ncbi:hypothetical protein OG535_00800 [Kitasatospora sp. NBC_00085]|uniref:hypothetical protein n=1 Tax=unclassified Kitasatospora TaxID=2633591 RepID=UPI002F909EDC
MVRPTVARDGDSLNTAALTLALFFIDASGHSGEDITLQGPRLLHHEENGSVSAASRGYADLVGAQFRRIGDSLTVQ